MALDQITTNFNRVEFATSHKKGAAIVVDYALAVWLQRIRDFLGCRVIISSGHRPHTPKSLHGIGQAADFYAIPNGGGRVALPRLFEAALATKNPEIQGGIGVYPEDRFIHIDVRPDFLRWTRRKGEYIYQLEPAYQKIQDAYLALES